MSSKIQKNKLLLYVVVDTQEEQTIQSVQQALRKLTAAEFSPWRPQASLIDCAEFYATAAADDRSLADLIPRLNKFWTAEDEIWEDYGYNTPMFHEHVYYLRLEVNK